MKIKKLIIASIILMFIISSFSAVTGMSLIKNIKIEKNEYKNTALISSVFCEFITNSYNIKGIETAKLIQNIYTSNDYNFNYITILSDVNNIASDGLVGYYNIVGYPTCIFQGGYTTLYNENPDENIYNEEIVDSQNKYNYNIKIDLERTWFADCCSAKAFFTITVTNNEASIYNGILKLYVSEIDSRYNYTYDNTVESFNYVLIDIPIEQKITIPPYSNITIEKTWIASPFLISLDGSNLNAIAVVAKDIPYIGYSDPPANKNSFTAYYIDQINSKRIVQISKSKSIEDRLNNLQNILNYFPNINNLIKNIFF